MNRPSSTHQLIASDTAIVDLMHQGHAGAIGTGVVICGKTVALIDPGPEACFPALRRGLGALGYKVADVQAVLLTHIHLDHAAATGTILREAPEAQVFVHPLGAPHMIDPARLIASATRLYGSAMKRLWGDIVPVPARNIQEVEEGASVELDGRSLEVGYTPGHARPHLAYFEAASGTAWTGDVGGIRVAGQGPVVPVTPPPEVAIDLWLKSLDRIMAWAPARLVPTHFGPSEDPTTHLAELRSGLVEWSERVSDSLVTYGAEEPGGGERSDDELTQDFADWAYSGLLSRYDVEVAELYRLICGFGDSWRGLARYWRKRWKSGAN